MKNLEHHGRELIEIGRAVVDLGLSPGASGNLSLRVDDRILITGTGTRLGHLTIDDLAVVDLNGSPLGGAKVSKETPLHLGLYRRERAFGAAIHLHSPWAVAASCVAPWSTYSAIPPLTPYFVMKVGQTPLMPYRRPGSSELGMDIEASPLPFNAALLANHGSVIAGRDLSEALERAIEVEEACRIAMLTTDSMRRELSEEQIAELVDRWGAPWSPRVPI